MSAARFVLGRSGLAHVMQGRGARTRCGHAPAWGWRRVDGEPHGAVVCALCTAPRRRGVEMRGMRLLRLRLGGGEMMGEEKSGKGVIGNVRQLARKEYLGDGVYAAVDEFNAVVLTTENGIRATNVIVPGDPMTPEEARAKAERPEKSDERQASLFDVKGAAE